MYCETQSKSSITCPNWVAVVKLKLGTIKVNAGGLPFITQQPQKVGQSACVQLKLPDIINKKNAQCQHVQNYQIRSGSRAKPTSHSHKYTNQNQTKEVQASVGPGFAQPMITPKARAMLG